MPDSWKIDLDLALGVVIDLADLAVDLALVDLEDVVVVVAAAVVVADAFVAVVVVAEDAYQNVADIDLEGLEHLAVAVDVEDVVVAAVGLLQLLPPYPE